MSERRIALALGGGGARGIAHVHVLKALDALGLRPAIIAGSSIGSIVGAGYAAGMSGNEIEAYFLDVFTNRSAVLAKLWRVRSTPFRTGIDGERLAFGQMEVGRVLSAFLPAAMPSDFCDLKIPLKVTATDYYGNALKVIDKGPLQPALAASSAVPVIFRPVVIEGRVMIDGGIVNPVPFDLVMDASHFTVAVDVVGVPRGAQGEVPSRIDAGFGASQLMMQAITNDKLAHRPPDLFLRPPVHEFRVLDFLKVREILAATASVGEETRRGLDRFLSARQRSTDASAPA